MLPKRVTHFGNSSPGYTLMELLLTLFIISVLAAIVMPTVGNALSRMEARAFVLQLEADIAFAQKHAIATERTVRFDVNRAQQVYYISEPLGPGQGRNMIKMVYFPQSVSVTNNLNLQFRPNATFAGQSNGGTIYVMRGGERYAEIYISLLSSRTRIVWRDEA